MSPLVAWLVLALLSATSAQNATSDQSLNEDQNPINKAPHNDTIETATSDPGHEHESQTDSPKDHRDEMPHLKFNPPDLIPFPKDGRVAQFWLDHPNFRAIPDLPSRDTEYPKWLLKSMGRIRPTTPASNPTENDRVIFSPDNRPLQQPEIRHDRRTWESEEILPRRNDIESRFDSNNNHVQPETGNTEFLSPREIQHNSRMPQHRPVPNNIQRPNFSPNQNGPILFRIPLNLGFRRIQRMRSRNRQRNPNNFIILRNNRYENQPFPNAPAQMVPLQRRNFRGIPVTISRPSVMRQPGILMLPMRNHNVPSRFNTPNVIQSRPPVMPQSRERFTQGPNQNLLFDRQNEILVDPQFSREPWHKNPVQDEHSQRIPMNRRHDSEMSGNPVNTWQNRMIQPNGSTSLPRHSGIGARNKRQSGFDSFDPFGMGNIFSFFPSEKEEPQNSFNWFPRDSMVNNPTRQSPVSTRSFNPNVNQRPVNPTPTQHGNFPQDAWVIVPPSSSNVVPTNRGSGNKQIPEDFMMIQPNKASPQGGSSNKMPWILSNMFGGEPFSDNNGNQMWTFQRPFDNQPGTNNKQPPPHTNREQFSNNVPTRPWQEERVPPPNDQRFPVQPPYQNFHPNRGQTQHSDSPPPVNWRPAAQRPVQPRQPQEKWRPSHPKSSQPQLPAVPHGAWIPPSTPKKAPVSRTNHFHEIPEPHHQHPHHHHAEKQPPTAEVHVNHEDRHHRKPIQPEIHKGKRKLSPSEVRHLLSLLPEFPKAIHKNPKSQTVGLTINASGNKQKRAAEDPILESADIDDGNLTRNYPGSKVRTSSRNPQSPKDRRKRDIEDVTFGSYGYRSGYNYHDDSYTDYSGSLFGFRGNNHHDSGIGDSWGNMVSKKIHNLINGVWDRPNHGYYRPHLDFGYHPHGHASGHHHPHHHHNDYWHGNVRPLDEGRFPGDRRVVVIPPAVPRADPNQISYTARFRYRFGIYPGYSDYIPSTDNHEIFFYYDAKQGDRTPDALIPLRSSY